jgi:hypothetical protein
MFGSQISIRVKIIFSFQKLIEIFRQWHAKVSALKTRVERIAPVKKRQITQSDPIRVKALCQYNTDGISITEEDALHLVDNSDKVSSIRTMVEMRCFACFGSKF